MADPNAPGAVSVTFKQEAKDGMWIVFHGTPDAVAENIQKSVVEGGLFDVAVEGNRLYKGMTTASRVLGASPSGAGNSDAWAAAQRGESAPPAESKKDEPNPLLGDIEKAAKVEDLHTLYGNNKAAFAADAALMDAWKARGKELTNA